MKKCLPIVLLLLIALLLSSCAGIGDGALLGGGGNVPQTPNDSVDTVSVSIITENAVATQKEALTKPSVIAQLGEIKSCNIFLTVNGQSASSVSLIDEEAAEVYRLFSEAGGKYSSNNLGLNSKDCIIVSFTDTDEGKESFMVGTNNYFLTKFSTTNYSYGTIDGLYNSLLEYLQ